MPDVLPEIQTSEETKAPKGYAKYWIVLSLVPAHAALAVWLNLIDDIAPRLDAVIPIRQKHELLHRVET
jgi:hypothetical protein